jgi:DHA2 family multidrug resistance protein-like MFS transporter
MKAGRREWIGLAVLALPSLLVSIDMVVLLLALPQITADLGTSATIMDSYGFLLSGFLVTMGTSAGDRVGRRKLLLIGAGAFTAASVPAAFAPTGG